jgi:hypothetical protein
MLKNAGGSQQLFVQRVYEALLLFRSGKFTYTTAA